MVDVRLVRDDGAAELLRITLLERLHGLDQRHPGERAVTSIIKQLEYLEEYLKRGTALPRQDDLNFGLLGQRFVREFDEQMAEDLSQLSDYLRRWRDQR